MAKVHYHDEAFAEPCGYLEGLEAVMECRVMTDVSPAEMDVLLAHGWRRFGFNYFRPVCPGCQQCVSLRIEVDQFRPSKSQRRAFRRCGSLRVTMRTPVADEERLALYANWHAMRETTRGWKTSIETLEEYELSFVGPHPCAREMDYYDGDRLVAVGLLDETPTALSSIYFFYDPAWSQHSIGTASVLFEVELARMRGLRHVYLGFCVASCKSTAYKARFRPHEVLVGRPGLEEPAMWRAAAG